jgi:cyclopropane fatty-acyl-phospholipid synthase-like methyltransferase
MDRVLEPEIMDEPEQVRAYAEADFAQENQAFVDRFRAYFSDVTDGHILDLGCGPADIPIRLARALPLCRITGVDASQPMIDVAVRRVNAANLADRITVRCERLQTLILPEPADAIVSNSLLHHLINPLRFWFFVKRLVKPGGSVLIQDLIRPDSSEAAQHIVDRYATHEPAILRRDFYNSLLAAFTEDEVAAQLAEMNLSRLLIDVPDDRHWVVGGRVY